MSNLRCHHLDRKDELPMISQSIRWLNADISKLEKEISEAQALLEKKKENLVKSEKWYKFVESTIDIHWINDPEQYIKDNYK